MSDVVNVLLPVFAIIALGTALRHSRFASIELFRATNRLVYWVALPAFLFYKTAESQLQGDAAVRVFAVLVGGMLFALLAGYLLGWVMRLPPPTLASFVQSAYRSNVAYVGLPIILLAVAARGGEQAPALQAVAVLSIALLMPIYSLVAVLVLLGARPRSRQQLGPRLRELTWLLITNPLILSCVAGLVVLALGWKLPQPLRQTLETVGDMATPLALLGIGASLTFTNLRQHLRDATVSAVLKTVLVPLAGVPIAAWVSLSQPELRMALIYLASPAAVTSYVMAQQMGADEGLAANAIVMSTLLSLPALAVVVAVT